MKIPLQDKIAELERRIVALESQQTRTMTTKTTVAHTHPDLDTEMRGIWDSIDALFKKAFR